MQFSSVQSLSYVRLFATQWITARQASLSITNSWSSPKFMCSKMVMPPSHLILCRSLLLLPPSPPSIRVFSSESTLRMRWPKYWSFSFSISPSNEHPGLVSLRMDWLDLLVVQGTLKSLLTVQKHQFFGTQLSSQSSSHIHTWCLVVSNSLWPHGLRHARLPCPSPTPRVSSDSSPFNWWCHPTISSSAAPLSSRP